MKKINFLTLCFAFALIFVCKVSAADSPTGTTGTVTNDENQSTIAPQGGDHCAQFQFGTNNFILQVNNNGTANTLGSWCQDWRPTGTVTVKNRPAKNKRIVKFNLSGTGNAPGCATTINISGKFVYRLSKDKLKTFITDWDFTGINFHFKGKTKTGTVTDCR